MTQNLLLEVAYSGLKGTKLIGRRNVNQIPMAVALAGGNLQANRPFPIINGSVGLDAGIANSIYNALNVRLEKRYSMGLNFLMNYTWAKNLESNGNGDSSFDQNGGTTLPLDSYNLRKERSYAPLDVPKVFIASYGYELPFGAGKHWMNRKGAPGFLFGGWQVNGLLYLRIGVRQLLLLQSAAHKGAQQYLILGGSTSKFDAAKGAGQQRSLFNGRYDETHTI